MIGYLDSLGTIKFLARNHVLFKNTNMATLWTIDPVKGHVVSGHALAQRPHVLELFGFKDLN